MTDMSTPDGERRAIRNLRREHFRQRRRDLRKKNARRQGVAPHGPAGICTVRFPARRVGREKLLFAVRGVILELATGFLRLGPPLVDRL